LPAQWRARLVGRNSEAHSATRPRRSLERVNRDPQNRWKLRPLTGLSAFALSAWSLKCGALSAAARAEWRNTLRYSALRAAQMPQNCARLAAHVQFTISEDALLYTSFVSLSRTFFIFNFFWRFVLSALLSGFFGWRCLSEISLRLSTFDTPVNTCNIRLRLRMSCDRKTEKG
jgi:hypothetical protein